MGIKLIKVADTEGKDLYFNPEHVTHMAPVDEKTAVMTLIHGEKVQVQLHVDDLAARITRA